MEGKKNKTKKLGNKRIYLTSDYESLYAFLKIYN